MCLLLSQKTMALFGRDALSVFLTRLAQENLRVILVHIEFVSIPSNQSNISLDYDDHITDHQVTSNFVRVLRDLTSDKKKFCHC